ncbi:MAG: vitamin B12 dependent-methionine synthase activation domain-containing protein [Bacteroidota bacterium]|nr:vitamin B12 dependent-methionine synthase activation domain-containing protein [Bacteroidota bacterium]
MNPTIYNFAFKDLTISKKEVVKNLHGGTEDDSQQFYVDLLGQEFLRLNDYSGIQGGYIETGNIAFDHKNKTVRVNSNEFKVGNIVFNELKHSDKIIVFTCTAGKPLCDYAKAEYKTDVLKGFLIESLANVVVETAMDRIQDQLRKTYQKQNLMVSNRFSPGYCSWNVAEQHQLFELLPRNFCGVTLTESALMQPIKSISGFIGVGKDIKFHQYKCKFCTQKECLYKRKPGSVKISI